MSPENTYPAIAEASRTAQRRALAVAVALCAAFLALAPFGRVALPRIDAFIPLYESTFALVSLTTAGFLLFGFSRSRLRAVLALVSGYFFASLILFLHLLTFPGVLSQSGLFAAGLQSSVWLNLFRLGAFPLFVIGYVWLRRHDGARRWENEATHPRIIAALAAALAAVCILTLLATAGHRFLPPITDGPRYTHDLQAVGLVVALPGLAALAALGARRPHSTLDLWLMVVLVAWLIDVALGTAISAARFDAGFYAGRLYGLFAVSIVPVVLLVEASRIAGRLDEAIALAEERNAQLAQSREELAQAQRLEALGQLTGGVAHDFNNLLTVVIGNLELISAARGEPDKIERLAQNAMRAAQRGENLVRQLLTYARKQLSHPQTVDLNLLIANIENLIRRVIGERIEVLTLPGPNRAQVEIDPAQFETAILNLAINARDAMAGGGRITIETRRIVTDPQRPPGDPKAKPLPYLVVAVSDTGAGMTPAVLARAFDPFFTTKEVGKGSGLGLSQVYGFTKAAGGHVKIRSELGSGTTVELYLPQSFDRPALPEQLPERVLQPPANGHETILLVEDDADVLAVTAQSLRELGYHVLTAVDAPGALDILGGGQPIDLLFSDVVIPGETNGAQLAVAARRIRPALKVLLTSGYTAAALSREHGLPDDLSVVDKPYRRDELARRLRAAIAG